MATATTNQSKSSFVKEFLSDHPEGNVKAVNEAWQRAGNEGTIGDTVIYKTRAEMGLTAKVRQKKTKTVPRGRQHQARRQHPQVWERAASSRSS